MPVSLEQCPRKSNNKWIIIITIIVALGGIFSFIGCPSPIPQKFSQLEWEISVKITSWCQNIDFPFGCFIIVLKTNSIISPLKTSTASHLPTVVESRI